MVITQREKGQYFTPENVVHAIVDRVLTYLDDLQNDGTLWVLDPSVGEGIFCKTVIQALDNKYNTIRIDAIDIDPLALSKAKQLVNETINAESCIVSFYLKNYLTEVDRGDREKVYDLIITNPPHNAKYSLQDWEKIRKSQPLDIQERIPSESALYFVFKSLNLLKDRGILSFILPKPFIYSNRWKLFRKLCLTQFRLLEVFDLANQFSGQLQEHVAVTIQKAIPSQEYRSGIWDSRDEKFTSISRIKIENALNFDNFLVGVTPSEQRLMEKLLKNHRRVEWNAFRGLNSQYRTKDGSRPLIEKTSLTYGFLLPERNYVSTEVTDNKLRRFLQPKIIAQRIISYKTKPKFQLTLPIWVDSLGNHITHETVINIVPPVASSNYIYAYGALIQSKLIVWWLQHAIYSKQFVTSKDLDKPYLNKIILPYLGDDSNFVFRRSIKAQIAQYGYPTSISLSSLESKLDQFFTIGEIFKSYLKEGHRVRNLLEEMIIQIENHQMNNADKFKLMKRLDRLFRSENYSNLIWLNKKLGFNVSKSSVEEISKQYSKMTKIKSIIDQIVFNLYGLSEDEIRLIVLGE